MTHVGLIGLGLLGSALAERLLAAGHRVTGFDLDPARCESVRELGGQPAESAREATLPADLCLLSLPTSDIAESVLGDLASFLEGKIVIDTTTGEPETASRVAASLAARGIAYLDATIVGSSRQVRARDVLVLVGGDESAYQACGEVWDCLARQVFYLGASGSGSRMKLVVNLVLGLNRAVLAEGLTFARACGVNPAIAWDVLRAGIAYSRVMDTKGRKMLDRNFEVEAKLSQHHKDVRLILAAAQRAGLELPLTWTHDQLLSEAEEAGYGEADNSAIIAAFERRIRHPGAAAE